MKSCSPYHLKELNRIHAGIVPRPVDILQIVRSQKILDCLCLVARCTVVYEYIIIIEVTSFCYLRQQETLYHFFALQWFIISLKNITFTCSIYRDDAQYHNRCWVLDSVLEAKLFTQFSPNEVEVVAHYLLCRFIIKTHMKL